LTIHEIVLALSLISFFGYAWVSKRRDFLWLSAIGILLSILFKFLVWESTLQFFGILIEVIIISAICSYLYRSLLILALPEKLSKEVSTAPLTAAFGLLMITLYAILGIFGPAIAPFGEAEVIADAFAFRNDEMLLGADQIGRDFFSRLIYGTRNTVGLALAATLAAFLVGTIAGLIAATQGGRLDQIMGRIADVIMSIPSLIFALLLLSILGPKIWVIIVAVAIIYAPRVFRLTRAVAGNVVVMDYIEAAKLRGEKNSYLIRKEILPNVTAPLVAEFGLEFCFVFLLVAGLSFLGLGIQPPTADWGSMVRENATLITYQDPTPLIPAAAIALLTISVNFVVDWVLFRSSGLKE
tara:strand:- start:272 stop:1333 length:1062 start_codon:yes stop_codon:yes gene_type:complete